MLSDSEMYEATEHFQREVAGLVTWSTWNYAEKETLKILENVCAWTGRSTEWPFPSFILWIIKMVLLRDFNINVRIFTYFFPVFWGLLFLFLISMEMTLNTLNDTLFILLNSWMLLLVNNVSRL